MTNKLNPIVSIKLTYQVKRKDWSSLIIRLRIMLPLLKTLNAEPGLLL